MAVRLSVVMVHSAPATPSAERVAQGVVGELIGLSGIDLVLVGPLDSLSESSTDRLTLSSIGGDIAMLDWRMPEVMHESLRRLGIDGTRTRHTADPEVAEIGIAAVNPDGQSRKLYFFNLNEFNTPEPVVASIAKLNAARAVRTFSLAPMVKHSNAKESAQSEDKRVLSEISDDANSGAPLAGDARLDVAGGDVVKSKHSGSDASTQGALGPSTQRPSTMSDGSDGLDPGGQDLDALIDELDQLDP